jgi:hypothetical protein
MFSPVAAGFLFLVFFLLAPAVAVAQTSNNTSAQIDGIAVRVAALEKDADTYKRLAALQKDVDDLKTRSSQTTGPQASPEAWRTLTTVGVAFAIAWALVSAAREGVRLKEVERQPIESIRPIAPESAISQAAAERTADIFAIVKCLLEASRSGAKS